MLLQHPLRFTRSQSLALAKVSISFNVRSIGELFQQRRQLSMATNGELTLPQAEYRQLGKSGLRVSVPILGAMSFGDKRWQPWVIEEDKVRSALTIPRYAAKRCVLTGQVGSTDVESCL